MFKEYQDPNAAGNEYLWIVYDKDTPEDVVTELMKPIHPTGIQHGGSTSTVGFYGKQADVARIKAALDQWAAEHKEAIDAERSAESAVKYAAYLERLKNELGELFD